MKLEINTTPKGFEAANVILAQVLTRLDSEDTRWLWSYLSDADVEAAKRFRRSLLRGFKQSHKGK